MNGILNMINSGEIAAWLWIGIITLVCVIYYILAQKEKEGNE